MLQVVGSEWIAPDDHATYAEGIAKLYFPRNNRRVHPHADRVYCKLISAKNHPLSLARKAAVGWLGNAGAEGISNESVHVA